MNALLKACADIIQDRYIESLQLTNHPELISKVAAKNIAEIGGLNELLRQLGYVQRPLEGKSDYAKITAQGWLRINELRRTKISYR